MCPRNEYFETFKLEECEVVFLGITKVSKMHDVDTTELKMFNDLEFFLHNVRLYCRAHAFFNP